MRAAGALTAPSAVLDHDNLAVARFVEQAGCYRAGSLGEAVERLHDAVRDTIDYSVFNVALDETLSASQVVEEGAGFCLHKSLLFVAGCRRLGVPAVLASDVVVNHVADPAMIDLVGGEEFLHWYASIQLHGRWIKAAPVFNALLCSLYGVEVLRFNPSGDSLEQRHSATTKMRFLGPRHSYPDPQVSELLAVIRTRHPKMVTGTGRTPTARALTAAARQG